MLLVTVSTLTILMVVVVIGKLSKSQEIRIISSVVQAAISNSREN